MKKLTPTLAGVLLCLNLSFAQYEVLDRIDWSLFSDNTLSGASENNQAWSASIEGECDNTGFFGPDQSASVFRIEDTEGTCGCPCVPADPNNNCGQNNNTLGVALVSTNPVRYCETRIRFTISATGVMCGTNDDQQSHPVNSCPLSDEYSGTDALNIIIVGNDADDVVNIDICGTNGANQEYIIDLGNSIFTSIQFTGGTQEAGESYTISDIVFEGLPTDLPPVLNAFDLTSNNGTLCENHNLPIVLQTLADPNVPGISFSWEGPDNFTSTESSPTIPNISTVNSGTYYVTVTDANGCSKEDQLDITVLAASDSECTQTPTFSFFHILCSIDSLPTTSDNGIPGTWSPSHVLADYAGQMLEFTFDPDDPLIPEYSVNLDVDDVSLLNDFGVQPPQTPIFCNDVNQTYDFLSTFQFDLDLLLRINGDNDIFSFIDPNSFMNDFENELRNLNFSGATPGSYSFFVEAISPCSEILIKSFQYVVVAPDAPLMIDTSMCPGDEIEIAGEIFTDSRTSATITTADCGSDIIVNVDLLEGMLQNFGIRGACQEYFYYDTIINNRYIGLTETDYGDNYFIRWDSSYNGTFALPFPASTGCDSMAKIKLTVRQSPSHIIEFDLCEDKDTIVTHIGTSLLINKNNPERLYGSKCDSVVIVRANILPVEVTTVQKSFCADQDTTINGVLFNKDHPSETIFLTGSNGCNARIEVDLEFIEPRTHYISERICPGDFIEVGGEVLAENKTNYIINLPRAASTGCDSIIVVDLEVVTPQSEIETATICPEDQYITHGQTFDINNPFGIINIPSSLGCDSLIYTVNVSFFDVTPILINPILCFGESLDYPEYGFTINESYLTDTVFISSADGCIQEVHVDAVMLPENSRTITPDVCQGGSIVIGSTTYGSSNPSGTETFQAANGCDSIVHVQLNILPAKESDLNIDLCAGGEFIFNNTVYNDQNTSGTELITTSEGCDSFVHVTVNILPIKESSLNVDLCAGGEFVFNNTTYDESNTSGIEQFTTADGCDSLVNVQVNILPIKESSIILTLCDGEEMTVNGTVYNQNNPSGTESYVTADGCDSIVTIDLSFQIAQNITIDTTLCAEDNLVIEGQSYTGSPVSTSFVIPSALGCDSLIYDIEIDIYAADPIVVEPVLCFGEIYEDPTLGLTIDANSLNQNFDIVNDDGCTQNVIVQATMLQEIVVDLPVQICEGSSQMINGVLYDENNVSGSTILTSAAGCDSIVNVEVTVTDVIEVSLDPILCPGESITVNGVIYDESNLNGVEQMVSAEGCDSVVTVSLSYAQEKITNLEDKLCQFDSYVINGTVYDVNNPSGVEILQTSFGCDSTVNINLSFTPISTETYDNSICEDESVIIYGKTYDANNPSGQDTIRTSAGCDSIIVEVDLQINSINESYITGVRCEDETVSVNGTTYDISNPSGVEVIQGTNGCDSVINIDLTFQTMLSGVFETTICKDESVEVGGEVFDFDVPMGSVVLQSSNGCDSVVDVTLSFYEFDISIGNIIGSCEGVANGSFTIEEVSGATPPFTLQMPDGSEQNITSLPVSMVGLDPGNFSYTLLNENGCTESFNVDIAPNRSNSITVNIVENEDYYNLFVEYEGTLESIVWESIPGLTCYDCLNPIAQVEETTTFTVQVLDEDGCLSETSVIVTVEQFPDIYLPNIMSMSSQRGNDIFYVQGPSDAALFFDMVLFDRWGNEMFNIENAPINDPEYGWDGSFNGKYLNTGVYIYSTRIYDTEGNEIRRSGDLTIVK